MSRSFFSVGHNRKRLEEDKEKRSLLSSARKPDVNRSELSAAARNLAHDRARRYQRGTGGGYAAL